MVEHPDRPPGMPAVETTTEVLVSGGVTRSAGNEGQEDEEPVVSWSPSTSADAY
jgi:hypothetical protein